MKLTAKQEMFCQEYLVDLNATQAALRAGYAKKAAQQTGSENLLKPLIAKRLSTLLEARTKKVKYTADNLLADMLEVLDVAKQQAAVEQTPQAISAFKGLADTVGKHVDVQAYSEKIVNEHTGELALNTNYQPEDVLRALMARRRDERQSDKSIH